MANETLELSEHELYFLPPGTPAIAPAMRVEVEVDGELRVYLARFERDVDSFNSCHAFWQLQNCGDDRIFCDTFCFSSIPNLNLNSAPVVRNLMTKRLAEPKHHRQTKRFWAPMASGFGVTFYCMGSASVTCKSDLDDRDSFSFDWPEISERPIATEIFWNSSQLDFVEFCQRFYDDEDSTLRFVLRWRELSDEQKEVLVLSCENGSWAELRRLFTRTSQNALLLAAGMNECDGEAVGNLLPSGEGA